MRKTLLTVSVFAAGMTTLGVELSASRLLGNVFGTSNIVWANIIGLILVYLTAGYFLGGRWADRSPRHETFYRLLAWAAFTAGLIPAASRPVLRQAVAAVEDLNAAVMLGSFLTVLLLFSLPVTLLGCVSPFAIRLAIQDTAHAGRVSGRLYAISTVGSILGTFLPVLWLIPAIGTVLTFLVFSLTLLSLALVGLIVHDRRKGLLYLWMPVVLVTVTWLTGRGPIKSATGQIYEGESTYNYIQVIERDGTRYLLLNEGQGIHSVSRPDGVGPTFGTWDYFLAAPFLNDPPVELSSVRRLGVVGLAAGTIPKLFTNVFGPIPIDGWEIDPQIVAVGQIYFEMNEENLNAIVSDGRWGLAHSPHRYSVISVDAYRLPYIPWHLTTREFFQEALDHLTEDGVVAINVGRTAGDRRIVDAMAATMASVFPAVHVVDVPATFNTIIYGTAQVTRIESLAANRDHLAGRGAPPLLLDVLARTYENRQPLPSSPLVFTDDRAPIETLTNSVALSFLLTGDMDILR